MKNIRTAIVIFPSTNCDFDIEHILSDVLGARGQRIWYKDIISENYLEIYDGIIIPGGFSYGDYLRAGAIAARTPAMKYIKKFASQGLPVLGICNGFQVLCESGLLPGSLTVNKSTRFICEWDFLRVEHNRNLFTKFYENFEVIRMPIAHREGRYVADGKTLSGMEDNQQVLFRYCDRMGNVTDEVNPNGSSFNIAGIASSEGNVVGLMPHPERASEYILGGDDGKRMFSGMLSG